MTVGAENDDYLPSEAAATESIGGEAATTSSAGREQVHQPDPLTPPAPLSITNWPMVRRPFFAGAVFLGITGFSAAVGFAAASVIYGLFSVLILMTVLWRLWVPVSYQVGSSGIVQRIWGRDFHIAWRAVGNVRYSRSACVLYRASFASPFASLQSVVLDYSSDPGASMDALEVESRVRRLIECYVETAVLGRNR
jgi:hypothetical protein